MTRMIARGSLGNWLRALFVALALAGVPGVSAAATGPVRTLRVASIAPRLAAVPQWVAADALAQQGYRIDWKYFQSDGALAQALASGGVELAINTPVRLLGIVIGKHCRRVAEDQVSDVMFGYTILNDVSTRDIPPVLGGWHAPPAKSSDTFAPVGPAVVTSEELTAGPNRLAVKMWVNDELRQNSTTADLIWPVEEIVSRTSHYLSLWPGDIIATGSPPGTALETGKYLKEGDVVLVEIDGVGALENPVGSPR